MRLFSFIGQVTAANAAGQITVLTSSSNTQRKTLVFRLSC